MRFSHLHVGILRLSLLVVLIAALLATLAGLAPAARAEVGRDLVCRDVLFIGARGSDQPQEGVTDSRKKGYDNGTGFGPEVYRFYKEIVADVAPGVDGVGDPIPGLDITYHPVQYPALGVPKSLIPSTWANYFSGLEDGATAVWNDLLNRAQPGECPNERIVLAGYSQGAMVMHRTVLRLVEAGRWDILDRIAGVALIADGDRIANDNTTRWGSAGELFQGVGMYFPSASGSINRLFPLQMENRIHSFCNARDIVCDTSNLANLGNHTKYASGANLRTLGAIAAQVSPGLYPGCGARVGDGVVIAGC